MRTTLTLDDDVAAALERLRKEREAPFKDLVNQALRHGLAHLRDPGGPDRVYTTPTESLGGCRLPSLDDVSEALAFAEGEDFR